MAQTLPTETQLVAELNDLLKLDHDAVQAYTLAIRSLDSGSFKLAVQGVAALGSDRSVLAAFKANERQVRDKYRRAAREFHTADVTSVLARAAEDESRHYAWVLETLEDLGFDADSVAGQAERAFEVAHKGVADTLEGAERKLLQGIEGSRRALKRAGSRRGLATALLTV